MKILVLADSHASLRLMRSFIDKMMPDMVIHLGDYFEDGSSLHFEYPNVAFLQVPGNCDRYRSGGGEPAVLVRQIAGVQIYMTHGHLHRVKMNTALLLHDARSHRADIALYGHTHQPDCHQEEDGLWVLNPGSCGYGGTAGIIEIEDRKISECRVLSAYAMEV